MGTETKTFQPENELPELAFDRDELQEKLIPEWRTVVDRLLQTDRGRQAMNDDKLRELIEVNSQHIGKIEEIISSPNVSPSDFSYSELRSMYYAHSPLISTRAKSHVFEFIVEGLIPEVDELRSKDRPDKALIKQRMIANILEELSIIEPEKSEQHTTKAVALNTEIAECDDSILDIPYSPRKLHARFSLYDMYFRSARKSLLNGSENATEILKHMKEAMDEFDAHLSESFGRSLAANHSKVGISGSLMELGLLSAARRSIYSLGEPGIIQYGASQGFLRQDEGDKTSLPEYRRPTWMWGFDLYFENYDLDKVHPVEVKKNTPGATFNGSPSKYLPLIDVSALTLGKGLGKFFELGALYFEASARGEDVASMVKTQEDLESIQIFNGRLETELGRIFSKLNTRQEFATNYFDARRMKPTTGGLAIEAELDT